MPQPEPEPEPILDTVVLRTMAFAHSDGLTILLHALAVNRARFPAEVYNRDEAALPLAADDRDLSELARGLRYARRQLTLRPATEAERYARWLRHATQISDHLARGGLVLDPLAVEELAQRDRLQREHGIGRGESAALVLALRRGASVIFLSADEIACRAAGRLGLRFLTLQDVLVAWVERQRPEPTALDALVSGLRDARFGLKQQFVDELRSRRQ